MNGNNATSPLNVYLGYTGAFALAQLGYMRAVAEHNVPIANVTATGFGAIVGAMWACNTDLVRVAGVLARLPWSHSDEDGEEWLRLLTQGKTFEQLGRPFTVVAQELQSGEITRIREGSVADAVRRALGGPHWFTPRQCGADVWGDAGPIGLVQGSAGNGGERNVLFIRSAGYCSIDAPCDPTIRQLNTWSRWYFRQVNMPGPEVSVANCSCNMDKIDEVAHAAYVATTEWLRGRQPVRDANG